MNPKLRGDVLATLGLTFSYGFALVTVVAVCFSFYARHVAREKEAERQKALAAQNQKLKEWLSSPGAPSRSSSSGAGSSSPAAPRPYTEPRLELPTNSVSGIIGGQQFRYEHAIARQSQFVLREGTNSQADRQITITTFVSPAELAGKTLQVTPEMRMTKLQITAEWVDAAGQVQRNWKASGYALRLKCGPIENGRMAGTIDLRLPGSPATAIKGDFLAAIK